MSEIDGPDDQGPQAPIEKAPETVPVVNVDGKLYTFNRREFLVMGASTAFFVAAACTGLGGSSSSSSGKPSGQLNVATGSFGSEGWMPRFGNTIDRNIWTAFGDQIYGLNRNDGLTFDPKEGIIDSSTISVSGTKVTWTIKIKKGIPFHENHGTLKASDVKFTYLEIGRAHV